MRVAVVLLAICAVLCAPTAAVGVAKRPKTLAAFAKSHAEKSCRYIGRDMERREGYDPRAWCGALSNQVESFVAEQSKAILRKVRGSMKATVSTAMARANAREIKKQLLDIARWYLLSYAQPDAAATKKRCRAQLTQWVLQVCTMQGMQDIDDLSDEAIENLEKQGVYLNVGDDLTDIDMYESDDWGVHGESEL